jgi:glycerol-3-phosphate dehydrogenase
MELRNTNIKRLENEEFDVLIVGGGINGAVSAAALAARGARVALIDARDFAGFTSQQSSNLVWGGIKYMEGYEFGLVAGLCKSRNELLENFPSTVKEIRFLMTVNKQFRFHPWLILLSTWLYWLLGRGKTRTPRLVSPGQIKHIEPLINTFISSAGIEYSDAFLHDNDARFVFNFVRSALDKGCVAANYVESKGSTRDSDGYWTTAVEDQVSGNQFSIRHRVLAFFADDERLFFAIPMANRTCIGTTDTRVDDPVTEVTDEDREFVLSNINAQLDLPTPLTRDDIIAERCGVRPLATQKTSGASVEVQRMSRKHVIEMKTEQSHISVFGGKLTDCLNVGNEICDCVSRLGLTLKQTGNGEPDRSAHDTFFKRARDLGLDEIVANDTGEILSTRLWRRYGADADAMLDAIEQDPSLCDPLIENAGIRRCEIKYLAQHEMIVKLEDYLRRRSKIELLVSRATLRQSAGLFEACEKLFGDEARQRFDEYFS